MASKTLVGIGSSSGGGALTVIYENINDHFADADWIIDSTSLSALSDSSNSSLILMKMRYSASEKT